MAKINDLWDGSMGIGAWSDPLLWSGWLSSSSTATPHKFIYHINVSWVDFMIFIVKEQLIQKLPDSNEFNIIVTLEELNYNIVQQQDHYYVSGPHLKRKHCSNYFDKLKCEVRDKILKCMINKT